MGESNRWHRYLPSYIWNDTALICCKFSWIATYMHDACYNIIFHQWKLICAMMAGKREAFLLISSRQTWLSCWCAHGMIHFLRESVSVPFCLDSAIASCPPPQICFSQYADLLLWCMIDLIACGQTYFELRMINCHYSILLPILICLMSFWS